MNQEPDECARCGVAVCRGAELRMLCYDCVPRPPVRFWKDGAAHPEDAPDTWLDKNIASMTPEARKVFDEERAKLLAQMAVVHPEDAPGGPKSQPNSELVKAALDSLDELIHRGNRGGLEKARFELWSFSEKVAELRAKANRLKGETAEGD